MNQNRGRDADEGTLINELENITKENISLHKVLTVLENEHKEGEKRERKLNRDLETMKEDISLLKAERKSEERSLNATIKQLRLDLYEMGETKQSLNYKIKQYNAARRDKKSSRRSYNGDRVKRFSTGMASVSGVPKYDERTHSKKKGRHQGKSGSNRPGDERMIRRYSGDHTQKLESPRRSRVDRRMSTPVKHYGSPRDEEPEHTGDSVEAAAGAFIAVLTSLSKKKLDFLWRHALDADEKQAEELVLEGKDLAQLLHKLVVYAFKQDNPHLEEPSTNRTEPLVDLLELRLKPHLGTRFITVEDFRNIPGWLEHGEKLRALEPPPKRGKVGQPSEGDLRKSLVTGSICLVWSLGSSRWCEGEVMHIKHDAKGEWLVIRYCDRHRWLEKEVQRYSRLLRVQKMKR